MTLGYRDIISVKLAKRHSLLLHATLIHTHVPPDDVPMASGVFLWRDLGPDGKFYTQNWTWEIGSMHLEFGASVESGSYDDALAAYGRMGGSL